MQILPAKGPQHAVRGQAMMTAIKHPEVSLASAATAASNAAGECCTPGINNEPAMRCHFCFPDAWPDALTLTANSLTPLSLVFQHAKLSALQWILQLLLLSWRATLCVCCCIQKFHKLASEMLMLRG